MRHHGLSTHVTFVCLATLVPALAAAKPIMLEMRSVSSARIVWDGEGQAGTTATTHTIDVYSNISDLGPVDPSDLRVQLSLAPFYQTNGINVSHIDLVLSLVTPPAQPLRECTGLSPVFPKPTIPDEQCVSIQRLEQLGVFPSSGTGTIPNQDPETFRVVNKTAQVIPFFADLVVPAGPVFDGTYFQLSAGDQDRLRDVLAVFGPSNLMVGLSADALSVDTPGLGLSGATFTVTEVPGSVPAVPEPASWLLLATGMALLVWGKRRRGTSRS